jgi:hypothetical protein
MHPQTEMPSLSSEPNIVESVGNGRIDLRNALGLSSGKVAASIGAVKLVRKDADGNILEEKTVTYGDNR